MDEFQILHLNLADSCDREVLGIDVGVDVVLFSFFDHLREREAVVYGDGVDAFFLLIAGFV